VRILYGKPIPTAGFGLDDRSRLKDEVRQAIAAGFDSDLQREAPAQSWQSKPVEG
jgi:hypothetical protein